MPLHTRERGVSSWVVDISVRLIGLDGDGSSKKFAALRGRNKTGKCWK